MKNGSIYETARLYFTKTIYSSSHRMILSETLKTCFSKLIHDLIVLSDKWLLTLGLASTYCEYNSLFDHLGFFNYDLIQSSFYYKYFISKWW